MNVQQQNSPVSLAQGSLLDVLIRAGMIALLAVLCFQIFAPFLNMMLWSLILAVALYPLHKMVLARVGGRHAVAATVLVLFLSLLLVVPAVFLANSLADGVVSVINGVRNNQLVIPPPSESVATWPLVGGKIYALWQQAATDLASLLQKIQPQISEFAKSALVILASLTGSLLTFIFSLIIAGVIMAYGESGAKAAVDIATRFVGKKNGAELAALSTATIRSVAQGVIGVAVIQAIVLGIGFVWSGVPAAGLLIIAVLLLGIAQVPAFIVSLPVVIYAWVGGDHSTLVNVLITVYLLVGGSIDNVLKPLLLGRGVDVPMPVVLIGALGGMVWAGIIGMFIGAVFLSLGYQIFMKWVHNAEENQAEAA